MYIYIMLMWFIILDRSRTRYRAIIAELFVNYVSNHHFSVRTLEIDIQLFKEIHRIKGRIIIVAPDTHTQIST